MSEGICKTSCELVPRQTLEQPQQRGKENEIMDVTEKISKTTAEKICQIYISKFVAKLNSTYKKGVLFSPLMTFMIQNVNDACITDIQLTGDLEVNQRKIKQF